jgi:hypothetical protein
VRTVKRVMAVIGLLRLGLTFLGEPLEVADVDADMAREELAE